jgi:hypothetical protein
MNLFKRFEALTPKPPLMVGTVSSITGGVATITVADGRITQARGTTTVGAKVFFRNGVIEGTAPNLILVSFTI